MTKSAHRRNPYLATKGSPQMRQSVVAFVDVLGYTEMVIAAVRDGDAPAFLARLKRALESALKWLTPPDATRPLRHDLYVVKVFTDNIVIGHPVHQDGEWELGHVLEELGCFQLEMANRGFFVRGGVSVGDLYMDENIVFGPALIDAYVGERDRARDPRIVLTETAVVAVKKHIGYYASPAYAPQTRELLAHADGQYFINYLNAVLIAEDDRGPYFEEVLKHKRRVEQYLRRYGDRPAIWSKYGWAAGYHNFFSRLHSFDKKYIIDLTKYEMTPSVIK